MASNKMSPNEKQVKPAVKPEMNPKAKKRPTEELEACLKDHGYTPEQITDILGEHPSVAPKRLFSPPSGNNHNRAKRKDLTEDYLPGHGELPAKRLKGELDAIIQEHRNASADDEHKSDVAAPFVCVLQSTGYGKTRAILELAKTKKLVYFVLKNLASSWDVPSVIYNFLQDLSKLHDQEEKERKWIKFLIAVKKCAGPSELYRAQIDEHGAFSHFFDELSDFHVRETTPKKNPLRSSLRNDQTNEQSTEPPPPKRVKVCYTGMTPITDDSLVVCFDEASALDDDSLYALRRAAKHVGIFSIYADTAASICQVMHPNDLGRFVAPIYSLNTTDLEWHHDERYNDEYERLFCAGRPRWGSYIKERNKVYDIDDNIESLVDMATNLLTRESGGGFDVADKKLLKSAKYSIDSISPSKIALFSCRFSLGPQSKMSYLLVKHSLATVVGVSADRSVICSSYPSEPLLAEVSARYTNDDDILRDVLQHVKAAFHSENKVLDPPMGDVGEMCGAAFLGYAMDHIRQTKNHKYMSESVELKDLLSFFDYGSEGINEATRGLIWGAGADADAVAGAGASTGIVDEWNVNFTHFNRPDWEPTQRDLKVMWSRRMAYYVPAGSKGLDLLIALQHKVTNEYGTLRVQVKNYSAKISRSECSKFLAKLLPSKCPPKVENERFSVGLVLSVNSIEERCRLLVGRGHSHYRPAQPDALIMPTQPQQPQQPQDMGDMGNPANLQQQQQQQQHQNGQKALESPVLQLAACFPKEGSLAWLSNELEEICSQNTAKRVDIDRFCLEGIHRQVFG